jgi:glycosyltransferase involved in cell wall biosynthesis
MNIAISAIGRYHMADLARQMLRLGQGVEVYTGNPKSHFDKDLHSHTHTFPYFHILTLLRGRIPPAPRTTWWHDRDMDSLGRWLARAVDPDTTDILDGLEGLGPACGRLMKARGKAWICNIATCHILDRVALGEEYRHWGAKAPKWSEANVNRVLAEYAESDALVVPSEFVRRSFLDRGVSSDRLRVCSYGVDTSMYQPVGKGDSKFRVLFVGSASITKGIGYLFDALRPLVEKNQCELWLVGAIEGAVKGLLEKNRDIFVYKGIVPRAELSGIYSQGSVLVLPSVQEAFGMVQAQAMACGLPVIATTNTGAPNLFSDGIEGFIVPARNSLAIRNQIKWMIDHPNERAQMGNAAMRRIKELGGWDHYGEQCLAVYREVLARKHITA